MNNNQENNKVWFVTGASKGLGLILTKRLLAEGFRVAATSRSAAALTEAVGENSENFLALEMDLLSEQSVRDSVNKALAAFGKIDTIVNNAGYGMLGALEELSDAEARQNFDVNIFGVLNVIRSIMPLFRAQRSGQIFNISSIGGYTANFPGWGVYCATKFALAGLTESLAAESKSFGVKVSVVYPGYFRTNFLSGDSLATPKTQIADYEAARQSQSFHQNEMDGNQIGDPEKAAAALIQIAASENPPLHLFLGSDAYSLANAKIAEVQKDLETWKDLTVSTDFEAKAAV